MASKPTEFRVNNLPRRQATALKRKAERLGVTTEDYLKQLIEDDLALDLAAKSTSLDELAAPFRKALKGVSDAELDRIVEKARRSPTAPLVGSEGCKIACRRLRRQVVSPARRHIMRTTGFASLLAVALCAITFAADKPKAPNRPQSLTALAALREYDKAVKDADEAARQARLVAERKLIDKLKVSLTVATKAGNLVDANAIDGQIKAAQVRVEADSPTRPASRGLIVKRAIWMPEGQEQKAVDLTEQVRAVSNGGAIQLGDLLSHQPDIANGVHKVLVINGSYGGTDFEIRAPDSGLNNFRFGPPSSRTVLPE